MTTLFPCPFSPWSPGLGDNHVMGWLTVLVYLIAAWACARTAMNGRFPGPTLRRERAFWWVCAAILGFLAVNKQLDLQSLLTAVARCIAVDQGWYEQRRGVQREFVKGVVVASALVVLASAIVMRTTLARTGLAIVGLGLVGAFVTARAASFHHIDWLINLQFGGLRLNWVLELTGPVLILAAAGMILRDSVPSRHPPDEA